tara:strand:+ start:272 stop:466 length:195 start_codon:yes stop_codon:yes gene_type:complete
MSLTPEQKLAALESEQVQIGKNYNEAKQVMANCERKLLQIQGGIEACKDIISQQNKEVQEDQNN